MQEKTLFTNFDSMFKEHCGNVAVKSLPVVFLDDL